jgi:hypothetical protein
VAYERLAGRFFYFREKVPAMVWWHWLMFSIVAWLTADALFALLIGFGSKRAATRQGKLQERPHTFEAPCH